MPTTLAKSVLHTLAFGLPEVDSKQPLTTGRLRRASLLSCAQHHTAKVVIIQPAYPLIKGVWVLFPHSNRGNALNMLTLYAGVSKTFTPPPYGGIYVLHAYALPSIQRGTAEVRTPPSGINSELSHAIMQTMSICTTHPMSANFLTAAFDTSRSAKQIPTAEQSTALPPPGMIPLS